MLYAVVAGVLVTDRNSSSPTRPRTPLTQLRQSGYVGVAPGRNGGRWEP